MSYKDELLKTIDTKSIVLNIIIDALKKELDDDREWIAEEAGISDISAMPDFLENLLLSEAKMSAIYEELGVHMKRLYEYEKERDEK